jgi:hypothetical protein
VGNRTPIDSIVRQPLVSNKAPSPQAGRYANGVLISITIGIANEVSRRGRLTQDTRGPSSACLAVTATTVYGQQNLGRLFYGRTPPKFAHRDDF